MNEKHTKEYFIVGGALLVGYFLLKGRSGKTIGTYPTLDFENSTPVPTVKGEAPGTYQYKMTLYITWKNADPMSDVIIISAQNRLLKNITVNSVNGKTQVPLTIETYQMRTETITVLLKNIAGREFTRVVARYGIQFPAVTAEMV